MPKRQFPFCPRSSRDLQLGDLIAVPCEGGRWAALQVTELKRSGVGSLSTLVVGTLPWVGADRPTERDVHGMKVTEQGRTRIELFTEAGLEVVANSTVIPAGFSSNYGNFEVGTRHQVWGWKATIRKARETADKVANFAG